MVMTTHIYVHEEVAAIQLLYTDRITAAPASPKGELESWVKVLEPLGEDDARVGCLLRNWASRPLPKEDFADRLRRAVAGEHGFRSWEDAMTRGARSFIPEFELAVEALLAGDETGLKEVLDENPTLLAARSAYGHGATLLHYAAANGVETRRQRVPGNLPILLQQLLQGGANPLATMRVYGSLHTTRALLQTSAHPFAAGVGAEAAAVLRQAELPRRKRTPR